MTVDLRYGRGTVPVEAPEERLQAVLRMRQLPVVEDPEGALRAALRRPLGTPPLADLARGKRQAVVVVSDVTRPVPNRVLLPPILDELSAAGLRDDQILLLIATGLHRPNEGAELESMLGPELPRRYRVVNHVGRDEGSHRCLGETASGTPIWLDRAYLDADLRILTGLVEPHLMAGYSGGRKLVCPGLALWRTVRELHSPRFLEHELCRAGVLEGNPLHAELLEIARRAGTDFIVNVTLDEQRRLTGIYAGELEEAHRAAVLQVDRQAKVPVEPAEVVLTSSAGYPLDTTFYQAIKGFCGALPAVKPGGTVILAASLSEGIGSPDFTDMLLGCGDLETFLRRIREPDYFAIDQWMIEELGLAARRARLQCRSDGIAPDRLARCFVEPVGDLTEAVDAALRRHGPDSRVTVIPEGPYVLPVPLEAA